MAIGRLDQSVDGRMEYLVVFTFSAWDSDTCILVVAAALHC